MSTFSKILSVAVFSVLSVGCASTLDSPARAGFGAGALLEAAPRHPEGARPFAAERPAPLEARRPGSFSRRW